MDVAISNIFKDIPSNIPDELTQDLVRSTHVKIERIVSRGHCSAPGFWYDQDWDEWILLIKGRATIEFEDRSALTELGPGDHLFIPAHSRHRVTWTPENIDTVWLAVHIYPA